MASSRSSKASAPDRARDAHRYLQASQNASYTGLPAEHREAYEGTMRELERKYPEVRTHALVGSDKDFEKPLAAGEREHQRHLREREGLSHAQVLEGRKELRGSGQARTNRSRTASVRAGVSGGRSAMRARRYARSSGAGNIGSTVLYAIGVGIALTLVYLALSPNGSKAFATLLGGISKLLRNFVGPVDPLAPKVKEGAKAKPEGPLGPGALEPVRYYSPGTLSAKQLANQRRHVNPNFGPAPSVPGPLGLVTGGMP